MKKLWRNRLFVALFLACICGMCGTGISTITAEAASVAVDATDVTLYTMDSWAEPYLTLPSGAKTSYQLQVTGASQVTYKVISGDSVTVSSTGLITPAADTWYWYGNIGYSTPIDGKTPDSVTSSCHYGKSVVQVSAGGSIFKVTANVVNYAQTYADQVMDEYIEKYVTESMSGYEKIQEACKFTAGFDYSVSSSSAVGMIVTGGGDCWASTDAIIRFCKKVNLEAWGRNANRDPGAGSGHMNVMVKADGTYYEADAGYTGTAPRSYSVKERTSLYSYNYSSNYDGLELYQYDGNDAKTVFEIPSEINGKPVVGIGAQFLQRNDEVTEVKLPSTIRYIGKSAFNSCENLKKINLPASLESIGDFVFTKCNALTSISCDSENQYFSVLDGVLYNKEKTELLYAPAVESLTVPSTVTTIGYYAFYYNYNLKSLTIPESVTEIKEGAFGNCIALSNITIQENQLAAVGDFAFADCYALKKLVLPASVKSFGDNVFYDITDSITVWGSKDSAAQAYAQENNVKFIDISHAHEYKGTVKKAASYTAVGIKTYTCTICGETKDETIALKTLGHASVKSVDNGTAGITIKWGKVTGATGYEIYRKTDGGKYSKIRTLSGNKIISYTDTTVKSGTTYTYAIKAIASAGGAVKQRSVVYGTAKTKKYLAQPKIYSLTNNASKKMTIKWKKVSKGKGYQIQYSISSKFKGATTIKVPSASTTKKVIGGLKKGKTYYVRIRSYHGSSYSAWSAKKKVKISR